MFGERFVGFASRVYARNRPAEPITVLLEIDCRDIREQEDSLPRILQRCLAFFGATFRGSKMDKRPPSKHWKACPRMEIPMYQLFYDGEERPNCLISERSRPDEHRLGIFGKDARYLTSRRRGLLRRKGNRKADTVLAQKAGTSRVKRLKACTQLP